MNTLVVLNKTDLLTESQMKKMLPVESEIVSSNTNTHTHTQSHNYTLKSFLYKFP